MSDYAPPPDGITVARHERLSALAICGATDAAPEAALDGLVRLAARLCDAPMGLITLVDAVRQVSQAWVGFDVGASTALDVGYCAIVVERGEPVSVPDTLADPAYAESAAAREGGVRFYAGVPLRAEGRRILGALSIGDTAPRPACLTQAQMDALTTLSAQIVSQVELRRSLAQQAALLAEHCGRSTFSARCAT